jgi:iron complex transport system permease protein
MLRLAKQRKIKLLIYSFILFILLFISFLFSLMIGSFPLSPMEVFENLINPEKNKTISTIIFNYRLPRALFTMITGFSLGVSGGVIQSLTRNPLADPYITGTSSGAALGAAIAFLLPNISIYFIPFFAFIGGISSILLTIFLAKKAKAGPIGFILAGIAVGILASAILIFVITLAQEKAHGIIYWIYGSFSTSKWSDIIITFPIVLFCSIFLFINARDLNILLLGEEHASQLGINAKKLWILMLLISSLCVSSCVAFSGIIGFIGLIAPHMIRLMISSDNRFVLPLGGLTGAFLLLVSDNIVKSYINPFGEMPISTITSMIGVPFFIYLLMKKGGKYEM